MLADIGRLLAAYRGAIPFLIEHINIAAMLQDKYSGGRLPFPEHMQVSVGPVS